MSAVGRSRAWIRALLFRRRLERETREEMAAHVEQAVERFLARGMSLDEARRAAQREFGHLTTLHEESREARGGAWVDGILADIRYAFRSFGRTPLTTVTIVLTLALGVGFSSAVFSVLHGIFRRPAPGVPDDPALVKLRGIATAPPFDRPMSFAELAAYAEQTNTFSAVAGWTSAGLVLDPGDREHGSVTASAQFVTPNYFEALGVRLAFGHGFGQSRFNDLFPPEPSVILSDPLASELFIDPRLAVGKRVKVNDVAATIVGVAPARFNGAVQSGQKRRIWLPISAWALIEPMQERFFTDPDARRFQVFARLREGVTLSAAVPVVRGIAERIDAQARSEAPRPWRATADVVPLRGVIDPARYANERGPVSVLFTVLGLLILVACTTTVSSLLVGGAVARRFEIGVRLTLGASRGRIVRQLLTEISILAISGGALGMWVFGVLGRYPEVAQDGFDVSPDWTTAVFTLAYAALAATLAGLSPALHASRSGLSEILKGGGTGTTRRSRLQRAFVVGQIAIAQPLMVALATVTANVLAEIPTLENMSVRERLTVVELDTRLASGPTGRQRLDAFVHRLGEIPGVTAILPLGQPETIALETPRLPGVTGDSAMVPIQALAMAAVPDYFAALGVPVISGRPLEASDTLASVIPTVINTDLGTRLFGPSSPLGRRIRQAPFGGRRPIEFEVVGVVDLPQEASTLEYPSPLPPMFVPWRPRSQGRFLVRTSVPGATVMPKITAVVRDEGRMFPLTRIGTLASADRRRHDSRAALFGVGAGCAAIVLGLASIGIYAMLGTAIGQRRREIGIRIALGARPWEVVLLFFRSGLRVTLLGLAIGLPLGFAGLSVIAYRTGVAWLDVARSVAITGLTVAVVGSLASWLPARRAAGVDAMIALRAE